jgi:hypothetical protein
MAVGTLEQLRLAEGLALKRFAALKAMERVGPLLTYLVKQLGVVLASPLIFKRSLGVVEGLP